MVRGRLGELTMWNSWCVAFIIFLATTVSVGCSSNTSPTTVAAAPLPPPITPTTTAPSAPTDYIASGPIVVEDQVDLAVQRDGVVAEILVETGAPVKKGQLLARLDDRQLTAERDAAAAKARSTEADLKNWETTLKVSQTERDRSEQLWAAHVIAKTQEEKAQFQYEATEFEVERQREDMKYAQATLKSLEFE